MKLKDVLKERPIICKVWNNDNKHYKPIRLVTEWIESLLEYVDEDCEYWDNAEPFTQEELYTYVIHNE